MELAGENVRLREFRPSDVDASLLVVGDDRVTRFLSFDSRSRDQAEAMIAGTVERAALEPRTEFYLAVTPKDGDELVGFARLGLTGVKAAKLGYAIAADHQGKGYATDAARTILNHAFGSLGLHRVTAAIGPDNAASLAVVEKLGFVREGTLRDHVFTNGAWRDSHLYSVLATEWADQAQA
ncbi:GNAT family N-acetyltransferase [Saccharopolyspora flava]|uniref:Protein N-acetyltransferase, RimJ/RimL family n=1 Tax=Saccharopolyspora flava TaxID=95161 RepID=A0A1I6V4B3_9PSEU|nr:GNAT family protein [Saccharopolyspora flava]SFT08543.1 Protein N-acetyltransferase, RimJ/RimL family [Saccharopolyspora flava]